MCVPSGICSWMIFSSLFSRFHCGFDRPVHVVAFIISLIISRLVLFGGVWRERLPPPFKCGCGDGLCKQGLCHMCAQFLPGEQISASHVPDRDSVQDLEKPGNYYPHAPEGFNRLYLNLESSCGMLE